MSYTDIYDQSGFGLNMGAPTVNQTALVQNAGSGGYNAPAAPANAGGYNAPAIPGAPGSGGAGGAGAGGGFFGQNGPAQFALGAIQTLGSLWNSFQQNKLAKQSFAFQKQAFETNLANQEQSYNTALEDRIRSRYVTEGKSTAEADDYISKNRL